MRFPQAAPHQLPARSGLTPHAQKPAQVHRLTDRWIATLQKARVQAAGKTPSKARPPSAAGAPPFLPSGAAIAGLGAPGQGAIHSPPPKGAAPFSLPIESGRRAAARRGKNAV